MSEGRITNSLLIIRQSQFDIRSLPRLVLIADRFAEPERADRVMAAARAGVRWIHLRDHHTEAKTFERKARRLVQRLREVSDAIGISVNTQLDVAASLDVHLHLGRRGPAIDVARRRLGAEACIGYSAHALSEAQDDRLTAADYFFFSPVYPTSSKPDHPGTGRAALASFCEAARPRPVFALGGITPERVSACRAAGAYGVAVLSGIMEADAPGDAARAYLEALTDEERKRNSH